MEESGEIGDGGELDGLKRSQSSIGFPYGDAQAAVDVAKALYGRSGLGFCGLDELAAEMNHVVGGAFRIKLAASRLFGFVDKGGRDEYRLSELGRLVISPENERYARAEAFIRVPLYGALYEAYRGHLLPPPRALEKEMINLGVAPKQADKARQVLDRSAKQCGYYEAGEDRLVRPKVSLTATVAGHVASDAVVFTPKAETVPAKSVDSQHVGHHPFVEGLLSELPASENYPSWALDDQAEWLRAAASIFKLLSKVKGRIEVQVQPHTPVAADG